MTQGKLEVVKQEMAKVKVGILGISDLNGLEWVNLTQMTIISTTVGRNPSEETVQLSHPYMTTGKAIALTRQTLVGRVMSLLFNMLSRLVIVGN